MYGGLANAANNFKDQRRALYELLTMFYSKFWNNFCYVTAQA